MKSRFTCLVLSLSALLPCALRAAEPPRPNILWISCEDTSPWLGFCGETYAITPNLDALARRGVHYTNAYVTAPVCSPCRYAIITGTYATSYGTQRLRSDFDVPDTIKGFPTYLRQAGYYCTNNAKTDYNTSDEKRIVAESWDECGGKSHWRNRKPGQPFFAVFNLMETHQSKIFESTPAPKINAAEQHDPATAPLPPYYPDTPAARRTMARVHDCITAMDNRAGALLAELKEAGVEKDTIVFFWPDHGQGIPRGKRTLWDTGLKIPLVISFPEKFQHFAPSAPGSKCDRLVSLMDFGPTLLSLLNLPIPAHMQGRAFLGNASATPREYVFGARDRVDEAMELSRSVRDKHWLYIRNFMPDLSWNQPETFSDQLELRREITKLAADGKLGPAQLTYAAPTKPAELLYDTEKDPWQLNNLAADPAFRPEVERLRKALRDWQTETRDEGLIHEWQAAHLCQQTGRPLFEVGRDEKFFPLERVLDTAWRVGLPGQVDEFTKRLSDENPVVRYWGAVGLRVAGKDAVNAKPCVERAAADASQSVCIEAAGILVAQHADPAALERLTAVLSTGDEDAQVHAARTIQLLGEKARPALPALQHCLPGVKNMFARWSIQGAIATLTGTENPVFKTKEKGGAKKEKRAKNR
jgi:N-sulfoglucosamine sulfohydrolase